MERAKVPADLFNRQFVAGRPQPVLGSRHELRAHLVTLTLLAGVVDVCRAASVGWPLGYA